MSYYRHLNGKCIEHCFVKMVDLNKRKRWEQCKDCGKVKP